MKPCLPRAAVFFLCLVGCDSTTSSVGFQPFTAVYVDPLSFQGNLACGNTEGAMQSYVATLLDVTDPTAERHVVASSPPTPCSQQAVFAQVAPGRLYAAEIDAYDEPACPPNQPGECLTPVGGWGSGARSMLTGDGKVPDFSRLVAPRWVTRCGLPAPAGAAGAGGGGEAGGAGSSGGEAGGASGGGGEAGGAGAEAGGEGGASAEAGGGAAGASGGGEAGASGSGGSYDPRGPTEAVYLTTLRLGGCVPIEAQPGPGGVLLRAAEIRGALGCGKGAGQVGRVEVSLVGGKTQKAACGQDVRFDEVESDKNLVFRVLAWEDGAEAPRWGASCFVHTEAGRQVPATCDALSERGSLRVPGAQICQGETRSYRATLVGASSGGQTRVCPADVVFSGLLPGPADVRVERRDAAGQPLGESLCGGEVGLGSLSDASCGL